MHPNHCHTCGSTLSEKEIKDRKKEAVRSQLTLLKEQQGRLEEKLAKNVLEQHELEKELKAL